MNVADIHSFLRNQISLFQDFSTERLTQLAADGVISKR